MIRWKVSSCSTCIHSIPTTICCEKNACYLKLYRKNPEERFVIRKEVCKHHLDIRGLSGFPLSWILNEWRGSKK